MQHAGHLHVDGPRQRPIDLAGNVVARHRLADDAQLLDGLHRGRAGGGVDVASRERDVEALAADELGIRHRLGRIRLQRDRAVAHCELADRCAELLGSELEQHSPRFCRHSAHRPTVALDAVGTAGASLIRGDVRGAHDEARLGIGHVELVAHHLPERGARPLTAVRLADEERGGVVGMNHDPGVELEEVPVGIRTCADGLRERAGARDGGSAHAQHERTR
jgi:hypothetical protein